QGFASRCGLVTCKWNGFEAADEKLPSRIVIKIPSALPFRKLNDSLPEGQRMLNGDDATWEVHDIEVAAYEFLEAFDGLQMPIMYYGIPFGDKDKS
ncbi:hypothetical protein PFISCL1PPCAC_21157, partial [Pristionchus fissidentatus]